MKFVIGCWLGLAGILSAGGLTFPEMSKELSPGLEETKISTDFKFKNETDKPITILKYDGGCTCLSVQVSDGKRTYAPGESGTIRANFDMENFDGVVERTVSIWLDGNATSDPSQQLKIKVSIPVLIELQPKTVKWQVGGPAEPKTIQILMKGDKPIHISSVNASTKLKFTHELKTIEEGKHYELVITPESLTDAGLAIFKIQTDCEVDRFALQQAFAVIANRSPSSKKQ